MRAILATFVIILAIVVPLASQGTPDESIIVNSTAVVGTNTGLINATNSAYYFIFDSNPTSIFDYELSTPADAIFTIELYRNDQIVFNSQNSSDPEFLRAPGLGLINIRIYALQGSGSFTLTITEYQLKDLKTGDNWAVIAPLREVQGFVIGPSALLNKSKVSLTATNPEVEIALNIVDQFFNPIINFTSSFPETVIINSPTNYTYFLVSGPVDEEYKITLEYLIENKSIDKITFSKLLHKDDRYEWVVEMAREDSGTMEEGDVFSIILGLEGPQIQYLPSQGRVNEPSALQLYKNDIPDHTENPLLFVLPVDVYYVDGKIGGLPDSIFLIWKDTVAVSYSKDSVTMHIDGFEVTYAWNTGLMLDLKGQGVLITHSRQITQPPSQSQTPMLKISATWIEALPAFACLAIVLRKKTQEVN